MRVRRSADFTNLRANKDMFKQPCCRHLGPAKRYASTAHCYTFFIPFSAFIRVYPSLPRTTPPAATRIRKIRGHGHRRNRNGRVGYSAELRLGYARASISSHLCWLTSAYLAQMNRIQANTRTAYHMSMARIDPSPSRFPRIFMAHFYDEELLD